jgi:GT2 family glycosyltransferase
LKSIFQNDYQNIEVIVVDDASTNKISHKLKKNFPEVKLIQNFTEKFPSECRNIGLKYATGDLVFFIDDDNVLTTSTIKELLKGLINKQVGLVGPIMYYYRKPKKIWCAGAKLNKFFFTHTHLLENKEDIGYDQPIECDYLPNAYMTRKVIIEKIGAFDNHSFPQAFEEIDFAMRISNQGYKIMVLPKAKIWHDIPVSNNKPHRPSEKRSYLRGRSRMIFYRKYAKWRLSLFLIDILSFVLKKLRYNIPLHEKLKIIKSYILGIIDGLLSFERY